MPAKMVYMCYRGGPGACRVVQTLRTIASRSRGGIACEDQVAMAMAMAMTARGPLLVIRSNRKTELRRAQFSPAGSVLIDYRPLSLTTRTHLARRDVREDISSCSE